MALAAYRQRRRPQRQNAQGFGAPAPVGGIQANSPIYSGGDDNLAKCIWMWNIIPGEYGCRVRNGSKEFATNIPGTQSGPGVGERGHVRTLLYYNDNVSQGSGGTDFFFAVSDEGIYDITAGGTGPWIPALAWPTIGGNAGWCSFANYTNDNGDHWLLVCDEVNGYYTFDGTTWAQGSFSGPGPAPDPANVVHVQEWQGRFFFTERDTTKAWYTDPGTIFGDVTEIEFGNRFIKGGHLVQLGSWSVDDSAGLDDKLVAISSSGDLLVFAGLISDANQFQMVGRWYIGKVPEGRRCLSNWGGDMTILSSLGVQRLTGLMTGSSTINDEAYITQNIQRYLRDYMQTRVDLYGWEMELDPSDNLAIITVPVDTTASDQRPVQFVLNTTTNAWCMFRDLDMLTLNKSNDGLFFGTRDGRVMEYTGHADDVRLDPGANPNTITFSLLTQYSTLGDPGTWKRAQFLRPNWLAEATPIFNVQVRYDYDIEELQENPPYVNIDLSQWDNALWDINVWATGADTFISTVGARGMGRAIAFAMRGEVGYETSFIGWDCMLDKGGLL